MGRTLATLTLLTLPLGGCSLLYDPDRLAPAADPTVPVICESLTLDYVHPTVLLEGQGDASSRPALLVIHGKNIAAGATISITPHDPADKPTGDKPWFEADNTKIAIDRFGLQVAVPVTAHVTGDLSAMRSVRLDVTVTQPCAATGDPATYSLTELDGGAPVLSLRGLEELTGMANVPTTGGPNLYSRVDVTKLTAADTMKPLIIRSMSSILIGGTQPVSVSASADGKTPGPGGFPGGGGGQAGVIGGAGNGSPGGGPGGGVPNGGGGGFADAGGMATGSGPGGPPAGDPALTTLESPNRGSGGAGGRGASTVLGGPGGIGGGGGGTIELTAGGDLTIAVSIEAKGGSGGPKSSDGSSGGGGSGGAVLVRAGGAMVIGNATAGVVAAGGGAGGTDAGKGTDGRVRFDSPARSVTFLSSPAVGYRGPMFAATTPMIVTEPKPRFTIIGQPSSNIKYVIESEDGTSRGSIDLSIPGAGENTLSLTPELFEGYNRICLLVTGVVTRRDESENCISLAYVRTE